MPDKRENPSLYYLGAGLIFYLIAASVVVFAPWIDQAGMKTITDTNGKVVASPVRTDGQKNGRLVYIKENCWLCHSQIVRGDWVKDGDSIERVSRGGDEDRYGPVSQPGESAYDMPHLFGTRRIGPDLAREGGKFADAWHLSHFLNPEGVTPGSIMPKFTWLYVNVEYDDNGVPTKGDPTVEMLDLISYVQSLGAGIGQWRVGPSSGGTIDVAALIKSQGIDKLAKKGKDLFGRVGCVGCHGEKGFGNGAAAATFPDTNKPRNFHRVEDFKYGHDPKDIAETISGGRPPYMPAHPQLKPEEVADLAAFVLSLGGKE